MERQKQTQVECMPRPLAEFMEPQAVIAAMKKYETRRNPAGLFRSAWNYTEYALNKEIENDPDMRSYYLETAQHLAGSTLDHPKARQDERLGALVLSSYIPAFRKRSLDLEITPQDCRDVYASLGAAINYLQPLEVNMPPQWRMAETAVLAVSARTSRPDLLLYPTSPREETSNEPRLNHDSYFYAGTSKIPIQQKLIQSEKDYDEWITVLTLQPLVEKGLRRTVHEGDEFDLAEQINYLLSLIVAESTHQGITPNERGFLNFLSRAVAAHRRSMAEQSPLAA